MQRHGWVVNGKLLSHLGSGGQPMPINNSRGFLVGLPLLITSCFCFGLVLFQPGAASYKSNNKPPIRRRQPQVSQANHSPAKHLEKLNPKSGQSLSVSTEPVSSSATSTVNPQHAVSSQSDRSGNSSQGSSKPKSNSSNQQHNSTLKKLAEPMSGSSLPINISL